MLATHCSAAALILLTSCLSIHAQETRPFTSDDFVTSYWAGPPAKFSTFDRFEEVKNADFTVAFPPADGSTVERNKAILDHCQKLGMKAVIADPRMVISVDGSDEHRKALDTIVKDYGSHPALLAYSIVDEPRAGAFDGLAEVVAYLKQRDPKHPSYINLLPTWAREIKDPAGGKFSYLGTATYEDYVREFVKKVKPEILCYDNYGMLKHGDRGDFHENLFTVRKVALEAGIPFWNIVLVTQHGDFRVLTEPELRFEAMQTMAFGGRGVVWFTYWSPQGIDTGTTWTHALINPDGTRDAHYDMVKRINADMLAIGRALRHAKPVGVQQFGGDEKNSHYRDGDTTPFTIGSGKVSLGVFRDESAKRLYALLANLDYKASTDVSLRAGDTEIERFDPSANTWARSPANLAIPAGDGVLLRCRDVR